MGRAVGGPSAAAIGKTAFAGVDSTLQRTYTSDVAEIQFEWDSAKDAANQRTHGVSFEEAATVFEDEHALMLEDSEHSENEGGSCFSASAQHYGFWLFVIVIEQATT